MPHRLLELRDSLPLPLAQLARRAFNAKSAVERHHCAYDLCEATLKLAAAARIGVFLKRALVPGSGLARELEALALPSVGHWVGFLRRVSEVLGQLPDSALVPLARTSSGLARKRPEWVAVRALATAAKEAELGSDQIARRATNAGVIGFFELISSYRNEVIGHGAQRSANFYRQFADLLLDAIAEVLDCPDLFDGLQLARPVPRLSADETSTETMWQLLMGLGGAATHDPAPEVDTGRLYLIGSGSPVSLFPLLVFQEDDLGREAVGFLNRTTARIRKGQDGPIDEVRRVDYLDYATGSRLPGCNENEALRELLSRLRGTTVADADLEKACAGAGDVEQEGAAVTTASAVVGDFELLGELGRGGMGVVYKARQLSVNRIVAIKVLPPAAATDSVALKRFKLEISALARCDHPNIVKVLTSGSDGDRHYYAMEFVEGADLAKVFHLLVVWSHRTDLREGHLSAAVSSSGGRPAVVSTDGEDLPIIEPPDPPQLKEGRNIYFRLAELFGDVAGGLAHLHSEGIIHRDIKPGNLMLTADAQRLVIMDLGLARVTDQSSHLTTSGSGLIGTLRYMAPEQLQRHIVPIDHRVDIYALGATLYEVATGRPFFEGADEIRLAQCVLMDEPIPPRKAQPRLPRDLATVISVATEKLPQRRYQRAEDLQYDLQAVATRRPIRARPPSLTRRIGLLALRRKGTIALLAMLAMLATVGGLWVRERARAGTTVTTFAKQLDSLLNVGVPDSQLEGVVGELTVHGKSKRFIATQLNTRGMRLYGKGMYRRAATAFELAARMDPSYELPVFNRACVCGLERNTPCALGWLQRLREIGTPAAARLIKRATTDDDLEAVRASDGWRQFYRGKPDR